MTRPSNSPAPSCARPRVVIVVARAARQLAAAAQAAGWQPWVADVFGDVDTRALAAVWQAVPVGPGFAFRPRGLQRAVANLRTKAPAAPLVFGSGFEGAPALLAKLSRGGRVLGSPASALARLQDPLAWSRLLRRLSIPHPRVVLHEVPRRGRWVAKRSGEAGGAHVRFAAPGEALGVGEYAQRLVPGRALSAVCLAGAHAVEITGYSEQLFWPTPRSPFRHAGSIALAAGTLPASLDAEVRQSLGRLVGALGLRGLCGIDFVLAPDGTWQFIELNARPPASFDLHVAAGAMFRAHLAACRDEHLPTLHPRARCRAQLVYFASSAIRIPNSIDWPDWVADRPLPGSRLPPGAPVCTLQAAGATSASARERLHRRLDRLRGWLGDADRRLPVTSLDILAGEHTHE